MTYKIEIAGFSIKGPNRQKNEDNMLWGDQFLGASHGDETISAVLSSENSPWVAAFDGIGGEVKGEVASFIAASALSEQDNSPNDIQRVVDKMNDDVCRASSDSKAYGMGTTAVAFNFSDDKICGFNVGDSRCYRMSSGMLERLSQDHVKHVGYPQRRLLTQYIGVDRSDFIVTPHQFRCPCRDDDIFMLCTDGITDVIIDRNIKNILRGDASLPGKLDAFRERLESRGVPDNATLVLAKVCRI